MQIWVVNHDVFSNCRFEQFPIRRHQSDSAQTAGLPSFVNVYGSGELNGVIGSQLMGICEVRGVSQKPGGIPTTR